jgi:hypothetical protein
MQGYKKVQVLVIAAILHIIDCSVGYPHRYTSSSEENQMEVQVMSYLYLPFLRVAGLCRDTLRLLGSQSTPAPLIRFALTTTLTHTHPAFVS